MNAPESYELFILPEGQRKVTLERDTKIQNACTFIIKLEDHTLGNLLAANIQNRKNVIFCGYKVPHPLDYSIHLRIQTTDATTPEQVFLDAIQDLTQHTTSLEETFKRQVEAFGKTHHVSVDISNFM